MLLPFAIAALCAASLFRRELAGRGLGGVGSWLAAAHRAALQPRVMWAGEPAPARLLGLPQRVFVGESVGFVVGAGLRCW